MDRKELIEKYLDFFKSKGHAVIPSASLVPENDPTTLFISAGMQPLVPYLLGQKHPLGKRIADVQKCIRTIDIEEVGDTTHHTFMEMLGNWSLGDYWKKGAIEFSFELFTKVLNLPIERMSVTCFAGNKNAPKDTESEKIWLSLGIPKDRIAFLGDNWWELAGPGPCGPDTEVFFWKPNNIKPPKEFDPEDGRWVEIWNDVLMEYEKDKKGKYNEASQKNVDNGRGLERILAVVNGFEDNYTTEIWKPIIEIIEKLSKKKYDSDKHKKAMRVIADHIKAAVFIISDGVVPSNTKQGYVLRRLIRRAIRYGKELTMQEFTRTVAEPIFEIYSETYPELKKNKKKILEELDKEEIKFSKTVGRGLRIFNNLTQNKKNLSGKDSFLLYQSYGFPPEMIEEESKNRKIKFKKSDFELELKKHQKLSRTATKGKFSAGLADTSEKTTQYHTATHLLLEALKKVLGNHIEQKGSNITQERIRFDFKHEKKMTDEEKNAVEEIVNEQIKKSLKVSMEEMPYEKAIKSGAHASFTERYPPIVKVYTMGNFSKEVCTGPHVKNTNELGKFKIKKEESSSAGVRRIKAILE